MILQEPARDYVRQESATRRARDPWRRLAALHTLTGPRAYLPGLVVLAVGMVLHYVGILAFGRTLEATFFIYTVAVLIGAWCGYGPGLLVTFLILAVLPFLFRPGFSASQINFVGLAVFALVSLAVSRLSGAQRQAERQLQDLNADLEQRVRQKTEELAQANRALGHRLAEVEALYSKLFIGLCFLDRGLRFVRVNEKLASMNGVSVGGHLGRTLHELLPKSLADQLAPLYRQVLETGKPLLEYEIQGASPTNPASARDWMIGCSAVTAEDGTILGLQVLVQDITERKRAERERSELLVREQAARLEAEFSRERLRITLASIGDGVIATTADGAVTFLNRVAESLTGWSTKDAVGRPLTEVFRIVNQFTGETVEDPVTKVMRAGAIVGLANHTILLSRTGARIPIDDSGAPIRDTAGRTIGIILVFRDVTERQRAEQALRESEQRFRLVADTAPVLIWESGVDKLCIFFNKQWLEFTGRSMEQELGNGWAEGVHPDDLQRCLDIYIASFEARREFAMEYRLRRADGEYRWILDHGVPKFSPDGSFAGYIGSCVDITDRRRAEAHRLELAAIVASSEDAIIGKTLEGIITSWNSGAQRMYGYTPEEVIGQPLAFLIPAGEADELPSLLDRLRRGEQIEHYETTRRRKDGTQVDVSLSISPIRSETGEIVGAAAVARDITERRRAEQERAALLEREKSARAEAESANRLKDEFLATISHELRGPLQGILGSIRLLRTGRLDPADAAEALASIDRNARAEAALVNDILDVSRIMLGRLALDVRPVDIVEIAEAALDNVRPAAVAKELMLDFTADPMPGPVFADPGRIQQALWNLLSNAVKFTPRGGSVSLKIVRSGSQLQIQVTDTGQGITGDFLPHVFERFRQAEGRTTRAHGGLGLGLAIVRHVVELHGGTVEAASEGPGRGASFCINLPLQLPRPSMVSFPVPRTEERHAEPPQDLLRGVTVLVVDDHDDSRQILALSLKQFGADVQTAGSVAEAMESFQRSRPDVLVTDIGMPGEDGYTLIGKVRSLESGDIPAIALSGYAMESDRARTAAAGFQMHLSKPVDPVGFVLAVGNLAGRC